MKINENYEKLRFVVAVNVYNKMDAKSAFEAKIGLHAAEILNFNFKVLSTKRREMLFVLLPELKIKLTEL